MKATRSLIVLSLSCTGQELQRAQRFDEKRTAAYIKQLAEALKVDTRPCTPSHCYL